LKIDYGEEFKVNSQIVKHYCGDFPMVALDSSVRWRVHEIIESCSSWTRRMC